jgi:hypothetical protein
VRAVAVDWSGRLHGAAEFIWLADVRDGRLVDLRNGLTREELVARLVDVADEEPDTVVGLDFAFSFPRWWCEERGWANRADVWSAMAEQGETLLGACEAPFWGRPGRPNPNPRDRLYRRTDRDAGAGAAKSVFQIGGAGAVGTGSIRGMPHLLTLGRKGFAVWPFDAGSLPQVVEIYPRALTGAVRKGSWRARHAYLLERFRGQPRELLERAAGSEDAFDATVSALVMAAHQEQFATLAKTSDPDYAIEGRIWRP